MGKKAILTTQNYLAFVVTEDMIKAGLKGNELIVYAYIEYKSYNVYNAYLGGINQMCRDLRISEPTGINIVKKLVKGGFIKKRFYTDDNNIKYCSLSIPK